MAPKELSSADWEALVFAPMWVYTAVAGADGPPETSHFRRLSEELDAANARFGGSGVAGTAVETLHDNIDAMWAAYQASGIDPRRGLKRARGVLKKVPGPEREAFVEWLMGLAVRMSEARHTAGAAIVTERERRAIRDVASWLGVKS
jgi:hypothetical protein